MHPNLHLRGLRTKIIAWSFVPTAIILTLVALVGFYAYQQVTQDLTIQSSRELVRLSAGQLATELADYSNTLGALARTAVIYEPNLSAQRAALAQASNRLFIFDGGAILLDSHGVVLAAQPARPEILGQDWSNREYFRQMIRTPGNVLSNVVQDGPGGAPVIAIAVPVTNERGELVGILSGMFRVGASSVSPFYGTIVRLHIEANGSAYLVDHNGYVFYHTNSDWIGRNLSSQPIVQDVTRGNADAQRTHDPAGQAIVASYAPIPGAPWGLVTEQNWAALLSRGQQYGEFLLLLLALGLVVPAVVVTVGVRRITQPLSRLVAATNKVADGDLGHTAAVHTGDEIEELSKQFNRMSARLAESYAALREREERLALVVDGTNDGIWDWNIQTDEVYFSPRWKAMLGYTDQEIPNHFDEWRRLVHPDDRECAVAQLEAYLKGQTPVYELEHRLKHKNGSYRWILARGLALRDVNGKPYRMAGSHTDITERKHAEDVIRQSEKRFSQVFRASPIPITITTLEDGRYVEVNEAWLNLFGYTREQVIDRTSREINLWVVPEQRRAMIAQLRETGSLRSYEHLARTCSGDVRDLLVSAEVIEINDERFNLSMVFDITERKQAQQALELRVAERTYELATLNAIAQVVGESLELKEIMNAAVVKAMEALQMDVGTAYSIQEDQGPDQEKHLVPAARIGMSREFTTRVGLRRVRESAIKVAAQEQKPVVWLVADYPDPVLKDALEGEGVRQVVNVPLFAKGKFVGAFNLGTRHERQIRPEELALLAAIGQQVALAVENALLYDKAEQSAALAERARLARELHDSVTQSLYSVTMYAEAAQLLLTSGDQRTAAEHLRELRDTAQEALGEMRLLIYELRPLALEKRGLEQALHERLEAVESRGGLKPELLIEGADHLPIATQQEIYHIVREALNNTIKHAHAHRVSVQLRATEDSVCLQVGDDGIGFDPAKTHGGLGLAGMKERVQRMGGTLDISSAPGQGTQVRVNLRNE